MLTQLVPDIRSTTQRRIAYRTKGRGGGPITRLMSPGDLGELVKPFVFLDHFDFRGGSDGGPVHPHSGIATHTTLLEGSLVYGDSTGKSGTLRAGSVEWMRAGGGVWHGGTLPGDERRRGFQLWVALAPPLELAPAESHYVDISTIPADGRVRVLLGSYGALRSPIPYPEPVTYLHVRLAAGERWTYQPPATHDIAWLAVSEGTLVVAGASVRRELVIFEDGTGPIDVAAHGDVELVIASAAKHPYPLVTGSYSVHTSRNHLVIGETGIEAVASSMSLTPWRPLAESLR
ncbi:MAG TPA: pirin family protein [Kofleriaceae bacterium]|jgi:redox-sensitive bicupin YhaK (pirin superfamily)